MSDLHRAEAHADDEGRMPLGEHLNELRRCLLRAAVVVVTLFLVGFFLTEPLMRFALLPWEWGRADLVASGQTDPGTLTLIKPTEGILFTMKLALWFALLVGGPYVLHPLWSFVAVGLHAHEKRAVYRSLPFSMALFFGGLSFGFFGLVPLALPILITWVPEDLARPTITLSEYFGTVSTLTLLMGFVFQLPLLMWLVVRAGLVEAEWLGSSRRVAIVAMLVFAAIMTPPGVITQVFVVLPMMLLFEIGLGLARRAQAAREREAL